MSSEPIAEESTIVFTNPTKGMVALSLPECDNCKYKLYLYDAVGKLFYFKETKLEDGTASFDFSNLAKGIYCLNVNDGNQKRLAKVVIESNKNN